MLNKIVKTLFIMGLAISAFSPFMTKGHFLSQIILFILTFILAVLVALGVFILHGIEKTTKFNPTIRPSRVLIGLAIILGIQIAAFPVIIKFEKHRVQKAKNFCERYIPALKEYQAVRDQYPETISLFQLQALKPGFLEGQKIYEKTEDGYIFKFRSPGRFAGGYVYYSDKERWVVHDSWLPD